MKKSGITFIDEIVQIDTGSFASRHEWLRFIVSPAFDELQSFRDRTIERLERIQNLVADEEIGVATVQWNTVVAAHHRLANSLQVLVEFVSECEYDDIVSFTKKLQLFFQVDNAVFAIRGQDYYCALRPIWKEALTNFNSDNRLEVEEIIGAELLHIQLKWAILHSDCISLQVDKNSVDNGRTG